MTDDWKQHLDALHAELVSRDDPVAWVTEADAVEASRRYPYIAPRGPVFGVAALDPSAAGSCWRLLKPVVNGMPQQARDGLNSFLWFTAKDGTDDPAARRALLAAVAVLEREPVDEVEALGVRYRVVRGDEFARIGEDEPEPPRPTDPEPADRFWDGRDDAPSPDVGFVLDPDRDEGPMAGALRLGLRDFAYTEAHFPAEVREDSARAVVTHPEVVCLPVGFSVAERDETGWTPRGALMPTPHAARRLLYEGLARFWALMFRFDERKKAVYARAAEEYRAAGRADEARVEDRLFRVCRVERLVRLGPDGPEPPRPSDVDDYGPMKLHPTLLEDGTVLHDD
ncbi:DUF5954 family protein [Streptomyces aurantiogriseus]|uniref:Aromatic ring-opening dioxygenase LigA n=1 Tax=Streptomyces aurantiogriseus TaxID=66870 RepID=A0A918KZ36_9ACTN|nr:DUF5954 family protein [Streptomyces aurantiogriseus]GGR50021.1 hypothetical protein GCM10010251_78850 [Streptomyces aurantiogriseus]